MVIHGRNLIISANGSVVAASKSCTVRTQAESIETGPHTTSRWKESIVGRKEWRITTDHLLSFNKSDGQIIAYSEGSIGRTRPEAKVTLKGRNGVIDEISTGLGGLNMAIIDPTYPYDFDDAGFHNYDTYTDPDEIQAFITDLADAALANKLVAVVACDIFNMTTELRTAIATALNVDLSDVTLGTQRTALCIIGKVGSTTEPGIMMQQYRSTTGRGAVTHASMILYDGSASTDTPLRDHLLRVGETYNIRLQTDGLVYDILTGTAHCLTADARGTLGNLATGSFEFQGTGPLTAPSQT